MRVSDTKSHPVHRLKLHLMPIGPSKRQRSTSAPPTRGGPLASSLGSVSRAVLTMHHRHPTSPKRRQRDDEPKPDGDEVDWRLPEDHGGFQPQAAMGLPSALMPKVIYIPQLPHGR